MMNVEQIREILDEMYLELAGASGTDNDRAQALDIILDVLTWKTEEIEELVLDVQEETEEIAVSDPDDEEKDPETAFAEDVLRHVVRSLGGRA